MPNNVNCPWCGRSTSLNDRRYRHHFDGSDSGDYCPLSEQPQPATGITAEDYLHRVRTVTRLATQLREQDPKLTHTYLMALPVTEVRRLLMVALAGLNIDAPVSEMYGWVTDLPAANTN